MEKSCKRHPHAFIVIITHFIDTINSSQVLEIFSNIQILRTVYFCPTNAFDGIFKVNLEVFCKLTTFATKDSLNEVCTFYTLIDFIFRIDFFCCLTFYDTSDPCINSIHTHCHSGMHYSVQHTYY